MLLCFFQGSWVPSACFSSCPPPSFFSSVTLFLSPLKYLQSSFLIHLMLFFMFFFFFIPFISSVLHDAPFFFLLKLSTSLSHFYLLQLKSLFFIFIFCLSTSLETLILSPCHLWPSCNLVFSSSGLIFSPFLVASPVSPPFPVFFLSFPPLSSSGFFLFSLLVSTRYCIISPPLSPSCFLSLFYLLTSTRLVLMSLLVFLFLVSSSLISLIFFSPCCFSSHKPSPSGPSDS